LYSFPYQNKGRYILYIVYNIIRLLRCFLFNFLDCYIYYRLLIIGKYTYATFWSRTEQTSERLWSYRLHPHFISSFPSVWPIHIIFLWDLNTVALLLTKCLYFRVLWLCGRKTLVNSPFSYSVYNPYFFSLTTNPLPETVSILSVWNEWNIFSVIHYSSIYTIIVSSSIINILFLNIFIIS